MQNRQLFEECNKSKNNSNNCQCVNEGL